MSDIASNPTNRSYITHEINSPNHNYVTMKFFPTGDRSPEPKETTVTKSYESTDGGTHRTTITTAKRSFVRTSGSGSLEDSTVSGDAVVSKGNDAYLQHALDEMSKLAGESPKEDQSKKEVKEDIVVRTTVTTSSAPRDGVSTWMTRERLRSSDKADEKPRELTKPNSIDVEERRLATDTRRGTPSSSKIGRDQILSANGTPLVWKSVENHNHLLRRYEDRPGSVARTSSSYVPKEENWDNWSAEIIKAEVGEDAYNKRLQKQKKIFEAGAKKGFFIEELPLFFKKWGLRTLFEKKVKRTNQRATHSEGIGAQGYAVVVENNQIPENDFFVPKKMFEVRIRHANFPTISDESKPAWRSLAIKFMDHDYDSPFDLVLQTGRSSPFFNTDAIDEFYMSIVKSPAAFKDYLISLPVNLGTVLEGMRKGIDSFTHVHYHSQMTYDFVAKDGKRRVARFRAIPADGYPDTGRLKPEEQRELWYKIEEDLDRYTEDGEHYVHFCPEYSGQVTAHPAYCPYLRFNVVSRKELLSEEHKRYESNLFLDADFKKRVEETTVSYVLQIQLHEWRENDTNAFYNPAQIWEEEDLPWLDLAKLRLLQVLPDDVTEVTRFNIAHVPEGTLGIPEPTTKSDFNSVPTIRKEIYKEISRLRSNQPPPPSKSDEVEYLVHVVTGHQQKAGIENSTCEVYISLIGTDSRTAYLHLEKTTKNDFARNSRATFTLKDKHIGDLQCVKVYKDKKGGKSDWFLDYVLVSTTYNNTCSSLPCYRWFNDKSPLHILRDGTPIIFEKELDYYMKRQRQTEVMLRQDAITWRDQEKDPHFKGLPGYISAGDNIELLPGDMQTEGGLKLYNDWSKHYEKRNDFLNKMRNFVRPRGKKKLLDKSLEAELVDKHPDSKNNEMLQYIIRNWRSDLEFGRQMMNGTMPLKIARLKDIPRSFPLRDNMVNGLLEGTKKLQDEVKAGRLFLVSYPELEDFVEKQINNNEEVTKNGDVKSEKLTESTTPTQEKKSIPQTILDAIIPDQGIKKHCCAPQVIMYLKEGIVLLPLAIQLTQDGNNMPLIFTPNDDKGEYSDWLVAKMWVKVAETNMHHFAARALGTLLLLEPVAIAVARDLPAVHPVSKLLSPYLKNLVTLNTIYRKFVISEGGALSEVLALGNRGVELMKRQVGKFRKFSALNLPENFANRGVLDPSQLPRYLYRDDSLLLWEAIRDFVIDIICIYYDGDEQVNNDEELALLLADLAKNGYNGRVDLPDKFTNIEELVQFVTTIIFRSTVQNTALSRGMADVYSYCLNAPPCLMNPPPTEKRPFGYTAEYMHSLLPPSDLHDRYFSAVSLMIQGYKNMETTIGQYPDKVFTDEKAVIAIKNFQKQLKEIGDNISQRDMDGWNYDYLSPGKIPVGFIG